jgi:hypothetical protein
LPALQGRIEGKSIMLTSQEITEKLQKALELLEKGRVAEGISIIDIVGDFDNKTDEQVELLEKIDNLLYC